MNWGRAATVPGARRICGELCVWVLQEVLRYCVLVICLFTTALLYYTNYAEPGDVAFGYTRRFGKQERGEETCELTRSRRPRCGLAVRGVRARDAAYQ